METETNLQPLIPERAEVTVRQMLPPPGLEIDSLVGKYVFGWTEVRTERNTFYDPWANLWRPLPKRDASTPAWSRNADHSLQVVEAMVLKGFDYHCDRTGSYFTVEFRAGARSSTARGELPYATCLAAVGALGGL